MCYFCDACCLLCNIVFRYHYILQGNKLLQHLRNNKHTTNAKYALAGVDGAVLDDQFEATKTFVQELKEIHPRLFERSTALQEIQYSPGSAGICCLPMFEGFKCPISPDCKLKAWKEESSFRKHCQKVHQRKRSEVNDILSSSKSIIQQMFRKNQFYPIVKELQLLGEDCIVAVDNAISLVDATASVSLSLERQFESSSSASRFVSGIEKINQNPFYPKAQWKGFAELDSNVLFLAASMVKLPSPRDMDTLDIKLRGLVRFLHEAINECIGRVNPDTLSQIQNLDIYSLESASSDGDSYDTNVRNKYFKPVEKSQEKYSKKLHKFLRLLLKIFDLGAVHQSMGVPKAFTASIQIAVDNFSRFLHTWNAEVSEDSLKCVRELMLSLLSTRVELHEQLSDKSMTHYFLFCDHLKVNEGEVVMKSISSITESCAKILFYMKGCVLLKIADSSSGDEARGALDRLSTCNRGDVALPLQEFGVVLNIFALAKAFADEDRAPKYSMSPVLDISGREVHSRVFINGKLFDQADFITETTTSLIPKLMAEVLKCLGGFVTTFPELMKYLRDDVGSTVNPSTHH